MFEERKMESTFFNWVKSERCSKNYQNPYQIQSRARAGSCGVAFTQYNMEAGRVYNISLRLRHTLSGKLATGAPDVWVFNSFTNG
jgi:hypothetical protein